MRNLPVRFEDGRDGGNTIRLLDGKTQIAMEYAYRHHQNYQAVLWALAES